MRSTSWWSIAAAAALLAACGAVDTNSDGGSSGGASLTFAATTGVEPLASATSDPVTVSGLGHSELASVDATTTLMRNGTNVGTSAAVQDGDTLRLQTTAAQSGLTKTATIQVGTTTSTWSVTARTVDIGGFVSGNASASDIQTSGLLLAVPFTPVQAFNPRYAGIMLNVPGLGQFQPKPQHSSIRADAQGVPGTLVVTTTTEQGTPSYLRSGADGSSYPVLGGGTYQVPDPNPPQADFGPNAPQLTAGTRYWLVNEYATTPAVSNAVALAAGAALVDVGPTAKQSTDGGVTWSDWGISASSPGTKLLPGMFVSD